MLRNLNADGRGPEMCNVTKERYRTFPVAVFQFAVRRTHSAQRLNAACDALGHSRVAFALATAGELPPRPLSLLLLEH